MNINTLEIVNKIEGNKDSINYFLNNLSLTNEGNVWMLNGQKGIGKSLLAKLIAANLLKIAYNENQIDKIFHPDLVILSKNNDKKIISVEEIRNLKRLFETLQ